MAAGRKPSYEDLEKRIRELEQAAGDTDSGDRTETPDDRNETIRKLKAELKEIQSMEGIIPICSHCRKIRDDKGNWCLLEKDLETRASVSFSHGICPECARELYGQEEWYDEWVERNDS